jgi:hypothetical protein
MEHQKEQAQDEFNFFKKKSENKVEKNELLDMLFYSSLTLFVVAIFLNTFYAVLPYKLIALLLSPLVNTSTSGLLIWLNIKALLFVKETMRKN